MNGANSRRCGQCNGISVGNKKQQHDYLSRNMYVFIIAEKRFSYPHDHTAYLQKEVRGWWEVSKEELCFVRNH